MDKMLKFVEGYKIHHIRSVGLAGGWVGGRTDGWMDVKEVLRIAHINQQTPTMKLER